MTSVTISRSFTKLLSGSHSKKNARIKKKKTRNLQCSIFLYLISFIAVGCVSKWNSIVVTHT